MGSTRDRPRVVLTGVVVRHSVDQKRFIGVAVPQQVGAGRVDLGTSIHS